MDIGLKSDLVSTSCARAICIALFLACLAPATEQAHAAWNTFGANAQHNGLSSVAAQPLDNIHWSTSVDLTSPSGFILIHYGSPLVTPGNTVIIPIRTASGGFKLDARAGGTGSLTWTANTDYIVPPHNWIPSYSPGLSGARVYFPGAGGTLFYRDNLDAALPASSGQLAFYGIANYQNDPATFNATVFVNTPIIADAAGNVFFGFRTSGTAPLGLQSGIARVDAAGNGSWVSATSIAADATVTRVPHQAAPALSPDGQTLYVVAAAGVGGNGYLVGLNPATLAVKESSPGVPMRVALKDPRNGANASIFDDSSASPMAGPDGDVYYGVLGNPGNGSRGWLLHFSADLTQTKTPGAFGWDNTAAVVPASAVPSYAGASSYLIFSKYNNYAGFDGGDGVNKIAVLDPNATMVEPHASSNGLLVMKEILTIAGPTPDPVGGFPNAVKEWCINAAAVDPITKAVMVNSEDGKLYRWNLATNTLSQAVTLSPGIGEAYTSTVIGSDGTVYATNWAILNAVGATAGPPVLSTAASRKTHGSAGTFDLALLAAVGNPTTEPRTGGAGGQHTIVFTFNKPVVSGSASVSAGTAIAGTPAFNGNDMIVPLSGVTNAQYVTVAVTNVVAGDGGSNGNGSIRIGFLAGDVNGSRTVTLSDMLSVNTSLAYATTVSNFSRDVNVSGALTLSDLLLVNSNLTQALPPP